jgi:hypothetical protein
LLQQRRACKPELPTLGRPLLKLHDPDFRVRYLIALLTPLNFPTYKFLLFAFLVLLAIPASAYAQETVFDVPSADILDKGKVYGELDFTAREMGSVSTYTPRVVIGIGHSIEIGANFNGLAAPSTDLLTLSPTIKWRPWKSATAGWSFYVGDDLFFAVHDRTYNAGNYVYAAFAKEWKHGTRVTAGAYDFTRNVVASANRAGGQFTFEQQLSKRWTLAAEWYTGNSDVGFVDTGLVVKLTSKLSLFAAYQIGNSGVTNGNHQFLGEVGYNFN